MQTVIADRVDALDDALLSEIESQTTKNDRRSLLALHSACRQAHGTFEWLEIGSHLGGSLQALVRDPACTRIVSIDARPDSQPDERGMKFAYIDNSTARMLELLRGLGDADVEKIEAIDASTEQLVPSAVTGAPQLCFVDGEHTVIAALRDARFCRSIIGDEGAIVFHDAWIVHQAIASFLAELASSGVPVTSYLLPDAVYAVELGVPRLLATDVVRDQVLANGAGYLHGLRSGELARAQRAPRAIARAALVRTVGRVRARIR